MEALNILPMYFQYASCMGMGGLTTLNLKLS